jgi:hypothetical protein
MNTQTHPKVNGDLLFVLALVFVTIAGAVIYGLIEIVDVLATTITKNTTVTDPAIATAISVLCLILVVAMLITAMVYIHRRSVQKRRHREFLADNPNLVAEAIYKTVRHMKRRTTYPNVRFGTVGNALENAQRYGASQLTDPFTREVVGVYRHFVNPKRPLPESFRPR